MSTFSAIEKNSIYFNIFITLLRNYCCFSQFVLQLFWLLLTSLNYQISLDTWKYEWQEMHYKDLY